MITITYGNDNSNDYIPGTITVIWFHLHPPRMMTIVQYVGGVKVLNDESLRAVCYYLIEIFF